MYVPHFLYPFTHRWTFGLFPCLAYCEYSECFKEPDGLVSKDLLFPVPDFLSTGALGHPVLSLTLIVLGLPAPLLTHILCPSSSGTWARAWATSSAP